MRPPLLRQQNPVTAKAQSGSAQRAHGSLGLQNLSSQLIFSKHAAINIPPPQSMQWLIEWGVSNPESRFWPSVY
jgi:hypothetical protein